MSSVEKTVQSRGATLATQAFGDRAGTPILLIMGATASMLWWPERFCEMLVEAGCFVIRYDNRDTGRSTTGAPGQPAYTMDDMAEDAIAVLDDYELDAAHLAGMSLGGMIAQLVALAQPSRVASLTAISSARFDEDDSSLPAMDPRLLAHFAQLETLSWSDRQAVVTYLVRSFQISAGDDANFDADAARDLAEREYDRAINLQSAFNHAMLGGGERWRGRIGEIRAPLLVIHGRKDPILSFEHGRRLAEAVPGAQLVSLDEAGHELNPRDWSRIVSAIVKHSPRHSDLPDRSQRDRIPGHR